MPVKNVLIGRVPPPTTFNPNERVLVPEIAASTYHALANGQSYQHVPAPVSPRGVNLMPTTVPVRTHTAYEAVETSILGVEGRQMSPRAAFNGLVVFDQDVSLAVKNTLTLIFAVHTVTVSNNVQRIMMRNDTATDIIDVRYDTLDFAPDVSKGLVGWENPVITGESAVYSTGVPKVFIVKLRLRTIAAIKNRLTVELTPDGGVTTDTFGVALLAAYLNEDYDPNDGGGTGSLAKIILAGESGGGVPTGIVQMTTDRAQRVAVDGANATLLLPPAPPTNETHDYTLRATVTGGGSLTLPTDENVTKFGDVGPFKTAAIVAVRAYSDGTAHLVARGS